MIARRVRSSELIKIIATACFAFLSAAIISAWNSPAVGYESSIYASTPLIFWVSASICITVGIAIVVYGLSETDKDNLAFVAIPILLIFLAFASILSLFVIRGYALWTPGDPLSHIGEIRNVIATGHINDDWVYPAAHIFVAQFSEICNISILTLSKLVPIIFGLLSVPFFYCLAKVTFPEKGQVIITTVLSMAFTVDSFLNLTPNALSNLMFPLVLFLMLKSISIRETGWKVFLIILIFLYPTFHPIPAMVFLLILISILAANYIFNRHENRKFPAYESISKFATRNAALLFIWYVGWISAHSIWEHHILQIYAMVFEGGQSRIEGLVADINYATGYNYNVAELFLKFYGGISILVILTFFALLMLWKGRQTNKHLLLLVVPLASIVVALIIFYMTNFEFGPERLIDYIVIITMLYSGFTLFEMVRKKNTLSMFLVIAVVLYLFTAGILQLYPSRYVLSPNQQISYSDIKGMTWYLYEKDKSKLQTSLSVTTFRYADLILTSEESRKRGDLLRFVNLDELAIPYHFSYDKGDQLGQQYNQDLYLILDQRDRLVYQEIYPEMAQIRLQTSDFDQLESDITIDKLYTARSFNAYYIHGLKDLK